MKEDWKIQSQECAEYTKDHKAPLDGVKGVIT